MKFFCSIRSMRMLAAFMAAVAAVGGMSSGSIAAQTRPTQTPTPPVTSTATLSALTPTPTVRPLPPYYDQLPRDKKGRVLGFPRAPILNYTPTMITGKRCPRIGRWTVRLTSGPGEKPAGVFSNPCVVQNALDDTLGMMFFYPSGHWDYKTYREEVVPLLNKDPMALRITDWMRKDLIESAKDTSKDWYVVCDKPTYLLVDAGPEHPVYYFDGEGEHKFWPNYIRFTFYMAAGNAEPFTCKWHRAATGEVYRETGAREQDMTGPIDQQRVIAFRWSAYYRPRLGAWSEGHWFLVEKEKPLFNYREKVLELLAKSPIKP